MGETLIRTEGLKKYFDTKRGKLHAVDDVTLSVEKGRTLGVVGESGCGKSTLGRVMVGLLDATDGRVIYGEDDITHLSRRDRKDYVKKIQMVFQDPYASLNPRMTVSETIAEPLKVNGLGYSPSMIREKVAETMRIVGLDERFADSYPHELDGGRRQRIGIARALVLGPEFVVCDEPVSALDVSIQAQILNLMMDLQDEMGLSYLFITHNLSVVKHISDDIAVMYLGECVEKCDSSSLFKKPLHPYTRALLKAIPVPSLSYRGKKREIIQGELTSPIEPAPGCRFASRCPYATASCTGAPIPLREVEPGHFVKCIIV